MTKLNKAISSLFRVEICPLILFKTTLADWKPGNNRLLIRNFTCSEITHELIDRFFFNEPERNKKFHKFLEKGANGILVYNDDTWIGYTWTVNLSYRKPSVFGWPRSFSFIEIPKGFPVNENIFWAFSARVKPQYRGKGVFLYLIEKSNERLYSQQPQAVLYSCVDVDNTSSIKNKMRMGDAPLGVYNSMNARILGVYFGNIVSSKLKTTDLSESVYVNGSA